MTRRANLILSLVLTLAGCGAMDSFERTLEEAGIARFSSGPRTQGLVRVSVAPETGRGGCGAIVGPRSVLTVAHVLNGARQAWVMVGRDGGWTRARVVRELPSSPENLVVLEVSAESGSAASLFGFTGFEPERQLALAPGAEPARVGCPSGTWRWGAELRPGDSGAPVLSSQGELVGLVTGRRHGRPVLTPLPTPADPALPAELARARTGR